VPTLYLCTGGDCQKCKGFGKLNKLLNNADVTVKPVRCQKVCKGPVVGLTVKGKVEWFLNMRGKKTRSALRSYLVDNDLDPLWTYRSKKRSGKMR
jgi:hypothetical protein